MFILIKKLLAQEINHQNALFFHNQGGYSQIALQNQQSTI
jgi:hypothetical protein